ncbi:PIR protein [Plasmodium vivax]|uniref:VIR protein n=1 Tax=Plasmodium vivax TaxID=5855 RepID=A0A564ZTU7_PLAVI|nr:PIR protein [Plasmodium vivax]
MDRGKLIMKHIPFDVFYDRSTGINNKLPSEQRNKDIITGIQFGKLLQYITAKNKYDINSWLNEHENKLKKHLNRMQIKLKRKEDDKYCKNLNYILDFVVQALKKFNDSNEFFRLSHEFDKNSRDILNTYTSLKCSRELFNSEDENLYIKKIMYDLFDDIEYMLSVKYFRKTSECLNMFNRIKYRWGILWNIYYAVSDSNFFDFDKNCTLSIIGQKLKALNCNRTTKLPQTVSDAESHSITEVPGSQKDLLESRGTEDVEDPIDVENPESEDPAPDDLTFSLPVKEDPPKLDTTYAAASLAGISLFGTILYKYGPFRNRLNSLRGAINGSNLFPLDNNVYDANIMNNFEYLQTGIPNDEYQLGYGSATDY